MTPSPGSRAPDFRLPTTSGELRLQELAAEKRVVLAFYTEDNTPLCSSEVALLKGDYDLLRQLDTEVIAISTDSLDSHQDFAHRLGGVPFPLASDETLEATRAYGVADDSGRRARRAVFIIDRGGIILHAVPWFQPGNPAQYEEIFRALGWETD